MLESLKNKRILIVVAHPDDELLGLGATMNKLIQEYNVCTRVIILGEGITSRSDQRDPVLWEKELAMHRENINIAQKAIGYHSVGIYDFPDNRFDTVALLDIIKVIEKEKHTFQPDVIFTHHGGDVNIDHQRTFEAVVTCCRPMEDETVKTIISFETASGTEWRANSDPRHFLPNFFVSIEIENLNAKINGMQAYVFESRPYPHPRSPEALMIQSQRWGVAVGCKYAEAFHIVRTIS
ncbi:MULTISPECIES: PIG-L deacetylase family protein [Sphingobacterium]|uniref:PIG-L deacetylase family protein n=1 Tax=Sphingobacterium TaxID=28453 RepID=UPI00104DE4F7|nr:MULTISPECIES: PIG-L family deacetylase [Sphingobacterium]MCW2262021.1 LmbE family N-acetylglucosaminyl deacetylase [Sphingobacterium kitahiroshimense]TCR13231.1 LmbE family N-acetylglucosaminyl deacetylase [Sphingobacterium sp. JUb78]